MKNKIPKSEIKTQETEPKFDNVVKDLYEALIKFEGRPWNEETQKEMRHVLKVKLRSMIARHGGSRIPRPRVLMFCDPHTGSVDLFLVGDKECQRYWRDHFGIVVITREQLQKAWDMSAEEFETYLTK